MSRDPTDTDDAGGPFASVVAHASELAGGIRQLATLLGVATPGAVSSWACGERVPQQRWLTGLASASGIAVSELEALRERVIKPSRRPQTGRSWQDLRAASGLSVEAYAAAVGVNAQAVRAWEDGTALPQPRWLVPIAAAARVQVQDVERLRGTTATIRRNKVVEERPGAATAAAEPADGLAQLLRNARGSRPLEDLARCSDMDAAVLAALEAGALEPFAQDLGVISAAYGVELRPEGGPLADAASMWAQSPDALGEVLGALLRRQGLSPADVSAAVGVGEATVRRWFAGTATPSVARIAPLAAVLGASTRELWSVHPKRTPLPPQRNLAWLLFDLRCGRGMSLSAVASVVGVDPSVVLGWERGAVPRSARLPALAAALGVDDAVLRYASVVAVEPAEPCGSSLVAALASGARHRASLSRASVAAAVGVSVHTVSRWERGVVPIPSSLLLPLAAAVGCDAVDLVEAAVPGPGFGPQLARARILAGLTPADVAARVGVHQNAVYSWERQSATPSGSNLDAVVRVLRLERSLFETLVAASVPVRPTGVLGKSIARERRRRGLTQRQLGRQLGVSWRTVGQWETGRTMPRRRHRTTLEAALGANPLL